MTQIHFSVLCCIVVTFCCVWLTTITVNAAKSTTKRTKVVCDLGKGTSQFDILAHKLWSYNEVGGPNYPENRHELKPYCNETSKLVQAMEDYKESCLSGDLKHYVSVMQFGATSIIKRFCSKSKYQRRNVDRMLRLTPCINRNKKVYSQCSFETTKRLMGIKNVQNNKKIPHVCCTLFDMINCWTESTAKTSCRDKSSQMSDFLQSLIGGLSLEVVCGEYNEDTDRCETLGKPPLPKSSEIIPKSPLNTFFDIVNSLPEAY